MAQPTKMTTVRLPADIIDAMQKLQDRDGIPKSQQIQRALKDYLHDRAVYDKRKTKKQGR